MVLRDSIGALSLLLAAAVVMLAAPLHAAESGQAVEQTCRAAAISFEDVNRIARALGPKAPSELASPDIEKAERAWGDWRRRYQTRFLERQSRGDEDSVVNLWMYGTSFTRVPPARARDVSDAGLSLDEALSSRLDDLLAAVASSRGDERLAFVRLFLQGRGLDPKIGKGRDEARQYLRAARLRALEEFAHTDALVSAAVREAKSAPTWVMSTIFKDRGLSSDTSLLVDMAIDGALQAFRSDGVVGSGSVRRVAIIGPGLDFINKADGHDFYPQQTIQPFAVIDSLVRQGLSKSGALRVAAIDVNARVNEHVTNARVRATEGQPYLLHFPLPRGEKWTPEVRGFWRQVGERIGVAATPMRAPDTDGAEVRAIAVRPDVVALLDPVAADIVTSRLNGCTASFDLVIATNVFVYYTPFEQALAAANVASLLRSGGLLLSNTDIPVLPPMTSVGYVPVNYSDRQNDVIFGFQRQ
jgi:hypothetical protein